MGSKGLKLGRLRGVDISMDLGVIPLLGVLSFLLATSILPHSAPDHVDLTYWTVAIVVSILFVVSLLAHELAHSLMARRLGIGVTGIVLWLFGGVSEMDSEPETPGAGFKIAVVGPLASLAAGGIFLLASFGLDAVSGPRIYVAALQWLGIVNVALGVFNLLPAAPLDGGHVVAAVMWKIRGDRLGGQISAAFLGRILGAGLAGLGLFQLAATGSWLAIWNIGLGLMLFQSARYREQALRIQRAVAGKRVGDLMDTTARSAPPTATVSQAVASALGSGTQSAVPIVDWDGRVLGLVESNDLYAVPKDRWDDTTALSVGRAVGSFVTAVPTDKVTDLLERMAEHGRRHAAVLADGHLIGLVGPEQIMERLQKRSGGSGTPRRGRGRPVAR